MGLTQVNTSSHLGQSYHVGRNISKKHPNLSIFCFYMIMLLLTNCEVHTGKYLDRSFEVRTERSEVRTKS